MNQEIYDQAIASGCKPKLAELLASRRVLIGLTDTSYFAGFKSLEDELGKDYGTRVATEGARHGAHVDSNSVYLPNVADYTGDPQAFFKQSDGIGEIVRRVEKKGFRRVGKTGLHFEPLPPRSDALAPENCVPMGRDLVNSRIREMIRENPDVAKEPAAALRRTVIEKHGTKKGRKRLNVEPAK